MDLAAIKALIKVMAASDLAELELRENGWTLRLSRRPGGAPAPTAAPPVAAAKPTAPAAPPSAVAEDAGDVQAPLAGIVHLGPAPGEPPFVTAGQVVGAGDTICLIEAMKMFNAVTAERAGTVEAVLVASGSEVEAGQALMRIV
jgi:acetyl-CoA carboxylase biotin carboxyl carrier protein